MVRTHVVIAALAACFAPSALAAEAADAPACMAPVEITADLVREAGEYGFTGYAGGGALAPFIIGSLSPTRESENAQDLFGDVVFVQGREGWRAIQPTPGESAIAVYAAPDTASAVIITMWQVEGPGQHWTLARTANSFHAGACSTVAFPETLNQPAWANEFLDLTDFDIRADGRGALIGVARVERDGREKNFWYRYETNDGGASWSTPRRLLRERPAPAGLYARIDAEAPEALVQSLQEFAASR